VNQLHTMGIVLRRTNYGEADRIITFITADYGKISCIAKGVRKSTSKLAGGIEFLSESDISFIKGRGELSTLASTKLIRHFSYAAGDLERFQMTASFIKKLDRLTEQDTPLGFYDLLLDVFLGNNTAEFSVHLVYAWGLMKLMSISGEAPNLQLDANGNAFSANTHYTCRYDSGDFIPDKRGSISPDHIKFLRLMLTQPLSTIRSVNGHADLVDSTYDLVDKLYAFSHPT
jgi:DNA repair protein RecO (recombination protein O)